MPPVIIAVVGIITYQMICEQHREAAVSVVTLEFLHGIITQYNGTNAIE